MGRYYSGKPVAGLPDWFLEREIAHEWRRDVPTISRESGTAWTVEEFYREIEIRRIKQFYEKNPLGVVTKENK